MRLELGLKQQVWAAAPKSARTAKSLFCSMLYWQAEAFSHHPRIERSCPNSRQRLPYAVREAFRTPPQQILRASLAECSRWPSLNPGAGMTATSVGSSSRPLVPQQRSTPIIGMARFGSERFASCSKI